MHHLYLLRHAKSSWALAGELDYERGLTERGQTDCKLIAGEIEDRGIAPGLVICSGATRARETLDLVAPALPPETRIEYDDAVYQATVESLAGVLRKVPEQTESVMLVGHNPSIHDFAVDIAADGDELERLAAKFPTCALAEFEFDGGWAELGTDSATVTAFIAPKQLRVGEHETL
jgi:phosphohistidine phosphatase